VSHSTISVLPLAAALKTMVRPRESAWLASFGVPGLSGLGGSRSAKPSSDVWALAVLTVGRCFIASRGIRYIMSDDRLYILSVV